MVSAQKKKKTNFETIWRKKTSNQNCDFNLLSCWKCLNLSALTKATTRWTRAMASKNTKTHARWWMNADKCLKKMEKKTHSKCIDLQIYCQKEIKKHNSPTPNPAWTLTWITQTQRQQDDGWKDETKTLVHEWDGTLGDLNHIIFSYVLWRCCCSRSLTQSCACGLLICSN